MTTSYLYEYDRIIAEVDTAGGEVYNIYGINLIMREVDGEQAYYLYNGHADVTALLDSSGQIIASYYYDAFGVITEQTGIYSNPFRYSGYIYDEESGLYDLKARFYDANIARFLQEDTYRGTQNDPLSLNLYTYCVNNPIAYWDPTGHVVSEADRYYLNDEQQAEIQKATDAWVAANAAGDAAGMAAAHAAAEAIRNAGGYTGGADGSGNYTLDYSNPDPIASSGSSEVIVLGSMSAGASGTDVAGLQLLLNFAGIQVSVDGIFGADTQAAVKAFQAQNGLTVDGIAGQQTLSALVLVVTTTAKKSIAEISDSSTSTDAITNTSSEKVSTTGTGYTAYFAADGIAFGYTVVDVTDSTGKRDTLATLSIGTGTQGFSINKVVIFNGSKGIDEMSGWGLAVNGSAGPIGGGYELPLEDEGVVTIDFLKKGTINITSNSDGSTSFSIMFNYTYRLNNLSYVDSLVNNGLFDPNLPY